MKLSKGQQRILTPLTPLTKGPQTTEEEQQAELVARMLASKEFSNEDIGKLLAFLIDKQAEPLSAQAIADEHYQSDDSKILNDVRCQVLRIRKQLTLYQKRVPTEP